MTMQRNQYDVARSRLHGNRVKCLGIYRSHFLKRRWFFTALELRIEYFSFRAIIYLFLFFFFFFFWPMIHPILIFTLFFHKISQTILVSLIFIKIYLASGECVRKEYSRRRTSESSLDDSNEEYPLALFYFYFVRVELSSFFFCFFFFTRKKWSKIEEHRRETGREVARYTWNVSNESRETREPCGWN